MSEIKVLTPKEKKEKERLEVRKNLKSNVAYKQWGVYSDEDIKFSKDLESMYQALKATGKYDNLTRADVLEFADRIALMESNRDPIAMANTTTATGLYQFITGTAKDTMRDIKRLRKESKSEIGDYEYNEVQYGNPDRQLAMFLAHSHQISKDKTIPFEDFKKDITEFRDWYFREHHTEGYEHKATQRNFDRKMINYEPIKDPSFLTGTTSNNETVDYSNILDIERIENRLKKREATLVNKVAEGELSQSYYDNVMRNSIEGVRAAKIRQDTTPGKRPQWTESRGTVSTNEEGIRDYNKAYSVYVGPDRDLSDPNSEYRQTYGKTYDMKVKEGEAAEIKKEETIKDMNKNIRWQDQPTQFQKGGSFSGEISEMEKRQNQYEPIDNAMKARNSRTGSFQNDDGTVSTHRMAWGESDGKYHAFPTLFQSKHGTYYTMPKGQEFEEAKRRGEVYHFDSKDEAESFAGGSWKQSEMEKRQNMYIPKATYKQKKRTTRTGREITYNILSHE